jgi:uncharacterized protein
MKNRFSAGLIALAFCSILAFPAYAQNEPTPEKKALIKELLSLTNASSNSETMFNQLMGQIQEPLAGQASNMLREWIQEQKLTPAERTRMEAEVPGSAQRIANRIRSELPKRISFGGLAEKVGFEIYDKHFTEAEIKDLVAFYKTPAAQKFIRIAPQFMLDMAQMTKKLMDPELDKLIIESFADEQKIYKTKQN